MAIKKSKKQPSKSIGDPKKRPPVKPQAKRAPAKPKPVLPKEGDYFRATISGREIEGIVRKHPRAKGILLLATNDDDADNYYDDADLKDNLGLSGSYTYDPKHDKYEDEGFLYLNNSGRELRDYEVVTSTAGKAVINLGRAITILGYRVEPNSTNTTFSFGCGNVVLNREALVTFVAAMKKLPEGFMNHLMHALDGLAEDGSRPEDVDLADVEAVLAKYPVVREKKKRKR